MLIRFGPAPALSWARPEGVVLYAFSHLRCPHLLDRTGLAAPMQRHINLRGGGLPRDLLRDKPLANRIS